MAFWIIACSIGEAVGIALVATVYAALDRGLLASAWVWILLAGTWEGLWLGGAQALVLRRFAIQPARWIGFTVLGAVLGYGLSLLGGAGQQGEAAASEPGTLLMLALGAGLGIIMGTLMGALQWLAARGQLVPGYWVAANAAGWAPAMAIIIWAAGAVPEETSLPVIALAGAAAGTAAGCLVGGATAPVLPRREGTGIAD